MKNNKKNKEMSTLSQTQLYAYNSSTHQREAIDVSVSRTGVINALGYTPSNSGLTQEQVEAMIQNNQTDDVSVVKLPFQDNLNTEILPFTNEVGIFAFDVSTDSSRRQATDSHSKNGTTEYRYIGRNSNGELATWLTSDSTPDGYTKLNANEPYLAGLCVNSDKAYTGFAFGTFGGDIYVRTKGKTNYQTGSYSNGEVSTGWNLLIDKYGICSEAERISCLKSIGDVDIGSWESWTNNDLPVGLSSGFIRLSGNAFFYISFKYGAVNPHTKKKYLDYYEPLLNFGIIVMFPWGTHGNNTPIWIFSYDGNGHTRTFAHWNADGAGATSVNYQE